MRLTQEQRDIIKKIVKKHFGESSRVYLFGSRVDDNKKGGDIDLYINAELSAEELFINKLNTISGIQFELGERKIDIATYCGTDYDKAPSIIKEAVSTGVEL